MVLPQPVSLRKLSYIFVSEAIDDGVEKGRDDVVEQGKVSCPALGRGIGPRVHVHKHGKSTEHGDHSDVGSTGGEGLEPALGWLILNMVTKMQM